MVAFNSALLMLASSIFAGAVRADFDPNSYYKKFVTCNAVERNGTSSTNIKLKLAYLDINPSAKKTLIMVHGWPSL
jgi:soluble epoxide hydrolase / lipid-phosphate phosphatase